MNIRISLSEEEADAIWFGAWMTSTAMKDCLEICDEECSRYEELLETYSEVEEVLTRIYYVYENEEAMQNTKRTEESEAVYSDEDLRSNEKCPENTTETPSKEWKIKIKEGIPYVLVSMLTIILWEVGKLLFG